MTLRNRTHRFSHAARRVLVSVLALGFVLLNLPAPPSRADGPTEAFTGSAAVRERFEFSPTGSMGACRMRHTATLLQDGRVLVVGGAEEQVVMLDTAELYDPSTGTWSATGSMSARRDRHTATLLADGRVLVAGGHDETGTPAPQSGAEVYNPVSGIWSPTGNMITPRERHTATLLPQFGGKVLVAGGFGPVDNAELYDPAKGTWSTTGTMGAARHFHTATLLSSGKVLVAGGHDGGILSSAELYDPAKGTWSSTDSMGAARGGHTATLLGNANVLVTGCGGCGDGADLAELYNPTTGTWSTTGSMGIDRDYHTATLLTDGRVLVAGGGTDSAELYNPLTGGWTQASSMGAVRSSHTATLLPDGKVLVAGGTDGSLASLSSAELGVAMPANRFTGTLTLPAGWVMSRTVAVRLKGIASHAAPDAAALSNNGSSWGGWLTITPSAPLNTTWNVGADGAALPIALRLRDVNGQIATVVTGTVSVDAVLPTSSMTALPATSPSAITLAWSGTDATSGVQSYDVQARVGNSGAWTDVLAETPATSTTYNGASGNTYYFRTRATDAAGNVEAWPDDYDTFTVVDTDVPGGALVINHGALATTSPDVVLGLSAGDVLGTVSQMRLGDDGTTWGAWQPYAASANYTLPGGDGLKGVYGQFKDEAGNVSAPVSDTITLDTAVGVYYGVSINNGALFTNQVGVTLSIGAPAYTTRMQVSNDNLFVGAAVEPFNSRRAWQITQYGDSAMPRTVYVRWLDLSNNELAVRSDDIVLDVNAPTGSVQVTPGVTGSGADTTSTPAPPAAASVAVCVAAGQHSLYLPVTLNCYPPPASGTPNVTLHLSATDDRSGVGSMIISNRADFACTGWESYATHKPWYVPAGTTTVYVRFRDNAGNVSATVSDTITR